MKYKLRKRKGIILTILSGLAIGAVNFWFQPYNKIQILGSIIPYIWSAGAFLGALVFVLVLNKKPSKTAVFISLAIMLAVLLRIIYDVGFWDKYSHNLAPLEILFCGIITFPSAFAGAYLAVLFRRFKK